MTRSEELLAKLRLDAPIFQAPMAGVSTLEMAAAVSNAGALGAMGLGAATVGRAAEMIAAFRARSSGPLHANVFCHRPAVADEAREQSWIERLRAHFDEVGAAPPPRLTEIYRSFVEDDAMLDLLVAERPEVVSFHFGAPPADRIAALRQAGIVVLGSATSLTEARALAASGVDGIIAQGWEAGGLRGVFDPAATDDRLGTLALVRVLVRALDLPVIAAGGIMDGAGIAAALALGASAAQLGTAFVACDESLADEGYRRALASDAAHHTTMTRAISGRPARCIANRFSALGKAIEASAVPDYPIAYDLGKALHAAATARGDFGYGAQWAGQGAPLARPMPAAELVATLRRELDDPYRHSVEQLARRATGSRTEP